MNRQTLALGGLLAALPLCAPARAAAAAPKAAPAKAAKLSEGVSRKVLPNGLTVIVKELHSAPVVAVNTWVKVGSVHELEGEKGITHFIEHMLFKGTEKLKVGELDKKIKAAGGYNNAHTRYESTDFIDVMPSDQLGVAMETMADAMKNSTFDAGELDRERKVVLEELHRAQDSPGFEAWNRLTHLVFQKHPYKHPVIGYKDQLLKMDRKLMVDYWRKWYRPQNLCVVIVGDVKAAEAQALAARHLGSWKEKAAIPAKFPSEPELKKLQLEEFSGEHQTTVALLGLPGPAELDKDAPAMDMALAILGQGLSSRLNQNVREKLRLAQDVSSGMFNGKSPGLIYLWADLEAGQVKDALPAIWAEVERMKREDVSRDELARQMLKIEHEEAGERMSMEGMAGKLGYYEALGDYRLSDSLTEAMRKVGPSDIRRVMNLYFKPSRATVVIYRSKGSKPVGLDAPAWQARLEAVAGQASPAPPQTGVNGAKDQSVFDFSNGLRLIIKPIRHTPLIAMQAIFPGGAKLDPKGREGAAYLLSRLLHKGAPGMDAEAIAARLDDLGASFGPYADGDKLAFSGQMLTSKFEDALELAGTLIRHATLPSEEVEKERVRVLKMIKDKSDQADDYVGDLFNEAYFEGTPYALPLEGVEKSVKAIRRDDLVALKAACLAPGKMLLVLTGDIEPSKARDIVAKVFGPDRWQGPGASAARIKAIPARSKRVSERLAKKQAHVMLGWPAPLPTDKDYYACRLLNSVMGEGMDSRLFVEVRDKRGLCYTVHSYMDRRLDAGAWRIYVGTQPENEKMATQVALEVARKLRDEGITAEELKSAKAYAKGIYQVARQDFGTEARLIAQYEAWGLGAASIDQYAKRVDAVTLEEVRSAARKYLQVDKAVIAVVRP